MQFQNDLTVIGVAKKEVRNCISVLWKVIT